ncbi:hypothetical protein EIP91_006824 [Steccherinum ochraceum]|uniref:Dipeptidase n=1 Tax=Steccherinum ochraceum TaxID=92696 RepID=A0A4R0R7M4_9APHY|nr:hypothetical protein EIP91_006824 [Steccherinum ochraceum]
MSTQHSNGEQAPLLRRGPTANKEQPPVHRSVRAIIYGVLTVIFVVGLIVVSVFWEEVGGIVGEFPKDPEQAARRLLKIAPIIDGHIDLPLVAREEYANNASWLDLEKEVNGHVDIPRLKKGQVGGFFWSAYVACPTDEATFELALTSQQIKTAIGRGRIASLLGIEGGHQLGNSIAVLRQLYLLGVRYVTLTHVCHNAFADSNGVQPGIIPRWNGLSSLGVSLIHEMNRIGMLVDLSHTSDETARQALKLTQAPVIWSHSSSRAVHDVPRNVPDDILAMIGTDAPGKVDAVVMVNFNPPFVANPGNATVQTVADHIDHIAEIAGKNHVGLGSDYDGIAETPKGLEDVSKYPALIAELFRRGWTRFELAGLTGRNLLRVMDGAERVAQELQDLGTEPSYDIYDKRKDVGTRIDL